MLFTYEVIKMIKDKHLKIVSAFRICIIFNFSLILKKVMNNLREADARTRLIIVIIVIMVHS